MKKTVLVLADHPLSPSGVGTQTKYMIEAMLKTGEYRFVCFGGAIKHANYDPVKFDKYGDDWVIYPVDSYGTPELIRSVIRKERPDVLWFMTDPRFWGWLWEIEDEVRPLMPMVYYHVWDNYPYPKFNYPHYASNDVVACISKVTYDIVKEVAPDVKSFYLPHAVDPEVFKPVENDAELKTFYNEFFTDEKDKMVFFWNNRNARRKQSGTLIFWFKEFLDKVGHDKAMLLMHTDVKDQNGQDLQAIVESLGLTDGQVKFSTNKLPPKNLAWLYNIADCTVNISDAEGFGLATLESLNCETPIIVNMTGGLQEQVTDGEEWFGIGIEPTAKSTIGSQDIPYIYEDRLNKEDFLDALMRMYEMTEDERKELGKKGRQYALKNYGFDQFASRWKEVFSWVEENCGSWDTRKNYKHWTLTEV